MNEKLYRKYRQETELSTLQTEEDTKKLTFEELTSDFNVIRFTMMNPRYRETKNILQKWRKEDNI